MAIRDGATPELDENVLKRFLDLDQRGKIMAEYVWIGGSGMDIRSKCRTLSKKITNLSELPEWNFDGSSTGQAPGEDSEVILKPAAFFPDPFKRGDNILVLCDCYKPDGTPIANNTRYECAKVMEKVKAHKPWWGLEQEYTMFYQDGITPFGWPKGGYPGPQGPYYCSNGAENAYGRSIVDAHYKACLYSGINISGTNAEVMPGQWEFQVGPAEGIQGADHLWLSRYLLLRVAESFNVVINFDPKPIPGDWNGAGCHCNYSTDAMRKEGGMKVILDAIEKLSKKHKEHIAAYGEGNERRLTGRHETASINTFSYGVANRGASIRIPRSAEKDGYGYFEDRRPASNCDPYQVTKMICKTTILG